MMLGKPSGKGEQVFMPKSGEISDASGVYRSECCGTERSVPEGHRFPPCQSSHAIRGTPAYRRCAHANAKWRLIRKAPPQ